MTDNICALNKNQNTCLPNNSIKLIGSHFIDKVDNLSNDKPNFFKKEQYNLLIL